MKSNPSEPARPSFSIGRRLAAVLLIVILAAGIGFCGKRQNVDETETVLAGETPLARAAARGDIKEIEQLIDAGDDVDTKDTLGRTPLHIAAFYGNVRTSAFLISKGADINAQDRVGMTPLHVAVISGGRREVKLLVEEKADIGARTAAGQTALHLSAATGQPKLTRFLIESGADPLTEDDKGKNPLFYAVQNKHPQTASVIRQFMPKEAKKPAAKKKHDKDKGKNDAQQRNDALPNALPSPAPLVKPESQSPAPLVPAAASSLPDTTRQEKPE